MMKAQVMTKGYFNAPLAITARRALLPLLALSASSAEAYIGPGAGLTAIGSLVALVAAILLAIVGFVWFPLKRLLRKMRSNGGEGRTARRDP